MDQDRDFLAEKSVRIRFLAKDWTFYKKMIGIAKVMIVNDSMHKNVD